MSYHILTGATGLLGAYLLREILREGRRLAVVVRPANRESGRQRIENVVARWEREAGHALPRPVVLEGDICKPNLGLAPRRLQWISQHCVSVIHNAASLTFHPDDRRGEPRRTNVEGTGHVLELCRSTGIRQFHHVSTAFVCGLREGRILENELDEGQALGNVYEETKMEAEKMVRGADFLDPPTIYRPATIVGDWRTGYTTTFHGFYAPLQLVHAVADKVDPELVRGKPLMELLGLSGGEHKNFVPVNWVAAVIAYLHSRPEHQGKTYHLTPDKPTPVSLVTQVMEEVMREYAGRSDRHIDQQFDVAGFGQMFLEQMKVYQSHWRDDPLFDSTNTRAAAPHLPPPEMDHGVLTRVARYAVQSNFGWPRPRSVEPDFDVHRHLHGYLEAGQQRVRANDRGPCLGLQVNGPGGGQWKLIVEDGQLVAAQEGLGDQCTATFYLNSKTFEQLAARQMDIEQAVNSGRVLIEGVSRELQPLKEVLHMAAVGSAL